MRSQRGFTLIELLAVIAIIGILAGLVAGTVTGIGSTGQTARLAGDQNTLGKAADRFFTDAFPQAYPVLSLADTDDSLNPVNDPRLSTDLGVRLIDFDAALPQDATRSFVPDFLKDVPETAGLVSWRIDTNTGNAFFAEDGAFLARPSSARFDVDAGSTRPGALESTATGERSDYTLTLSMKKGDAALEQIEIAIPEGYIIGGQALAADDVVGNLVVSFGPDNSWDSGETIDIFPVPVKVVSTNVWKAVVNYDSNLSTGISPNVEVKEGSAVQQGGSARPISDIRTHTINVTPPVGDSPGKLVITMDRSNEDVDGRAVYTDADANEATESFTLELFGTVGSTTLIKNPAAKAVYRWLAQQQTAIAVDDTFERLAGNQAVVIKNVTGVINGGDGDGGGASNTPPSVTITSPAGGTFTDSESISFAGAASDTEDGNLTDSLVWTLSTGVAIGFGGSFSTALAEGDHTITASVIDSGALSGSAEITITVTGAPTPDPTPEPTPVTPPSGLVSWWPGDGNADDIVYGNHGTLVNGATFAAGYVDQAFIFDGTDDYVDLGTEVAQGVTALTYEAWINPDDVSNLDGIVAGRLLANQMFIDNNGNLFAYRWSSDGTAFATSQDTNTSVPTATWTHVAATFDATTIKAYINGVEVGSKAYAFPLKDSAFPMFIGTDTNNDRFFDGLIDEVSVYDRALTASEVLSIFNAGSAGKIKSSTITVNSTADAPDANPGDGNCETTTAGHCSLRAAITEANASPNPATIILPAGIYTLTVAGTGEDAAATGDLDITEDLIISGAGAASTVIDGNALDRVFEIGPGLSVEISGVTIRNGAADQGGAIFNAGELTLNTVVVTNNTTTGEGGGIYNSGTLTLNSSTVSGNTSSTLGGGPGGGIYNSGTLTLNGSTVSGNQPATNNTAGGGIFNGGTAVLNSSIISANSASHGGGFYNFQGVAAITASTIAGNSGSQGSGLHNDGGTMTLLSSTISGNNGFTGGGIQNRGVGGTLTITNSTISGNTAQNGGAVYNRKTMIFINTTISNNSTLGANAAINGSLAKDPAATYSFTNTIIAGNLGGLNCTGTNFFSQGHNLDDDNSCNLVDGTDISGGSADLGPLANYGGPTFTHALLASSQAVDAGDGGTAPGTDQRGVARPQGAQVDIGAYELAPASPLAWGRNFEGELGNGSAVSSSVVLAVSGLADMVGVAGGARHSLALMPDGTVQAWGRNSEGQLGDGTTAGRLTPLPVPGLTGVVAVAAIPGGSHSIALKSDGTVWTWGYNVSGALGDNSTTAKSTPAQVSGLSGIVAVAGGARHSLALKFDGTVWARGRNSEGQLGDGTTTIRLTPVQVSGLTGVVEISAGFWHSLARKSDGTVWAWGLNADGQLGNGATANTSTPVQVAGLIGAIAISAGDGHSLAAKTDGTAWAWGGNGFGQLGDGTATNSSIPVQVDGLTDVVAVAAGKNHSLGLRSDGTVSAWGYNIYGQLGNGSTIHSNTPVTVSGLTDVLTIASGEFHNLAAKVTP